MTDNLVLEAKSVSKFFGTITALQNVDLHLNKGEVLGVVGDNGAGKSTLMKVLSGLYKPSEGSLFFDKEIEKFDVKPTNLNSLLKNADIIFILASITSSNESMINNSKLKLIKDGSVFVLMSRAAIINFDDFFNFLKNRNVFAAIDVFPQEPFPKNHKLRKLKNVIFSPHRAGALDSAFKEMGELVIQDLKLISKGLPPKLCKKAERETVKYLRSKPVDIN